MVGQSLQEMDLPFERQLDLRLTRIASIARDVKLFEFESADGQPLPDAEAGAHIGLILPNGLERQYSLLDPGPAPKRYAIAVKRDVESSGGSAFMHTALPVGARLKGTGPRNNFPLTEDASLSVFFAGGIGFTPIRSMIRRLEALGRPWRLHYACRSRDDAAFLDELTDRPSVHLHFDDEAGALLPIASLTAGAPADADLYCCGPAPMLAAFEAAAAGRPSARRHVEYFTQKYEAALDGGYTVALARSGTEFKIPPGKTILDVLRDAGMSLTSSCEEGICGSCETKVISGTPDHRDAILSDEERQVSRTMMICCSGAKSEKLVLDL